MQGIIATTPLRGESLLGFMRRFGHINGYNETQSFFARTGTGYGRPLVENLPEVAQRLGIETTELATIAPSRAPAEPALDWRFERHNSDPVCPKCVSEGEPFHQSWRHALVTCCAKHNVRLQDFCPACHNHLTPSNGGYDSCSCGFRLDRFPQEAGLPHEGLISGWIAGTSEFAESHEAFANQRKPPSDIGAFIQFLASGIVENRTGKNGKTALPKTVSESVAHLKPIASILDDWPRGFETFVDQLLEDGDPSASSAPERLGNWYQRLMKFKNPAYQPFKDATARSIARSFKGPYLGSLVSDQPKTWKPASDAASEIGISAQRLVQAVQNGDVAGKQTRTGFGHRHTAVPMFEVRNICVERESYWDGKKSRGFLGVSRIQFNLLRETKLIVEIPIAERPALVDGRFFADSVKELVTGIRNVESDSLEETIAFSGLTLRRTTDRAALMKLFGQIGNGTIRPASAPLDAKLAEFRFLISDVESVLRSERHSLDWTANDVAKLTGWKAQSVTRWCKEGLLHSRTVPHGSGVSFLIGPAQLSAFQSEYVPLAKIAKSRKTTSRRLLSTLALKGIKTFGAEIEGGTSRGHLVKLEDLVALAN